MTILIHMEMPRACGECPFERDTMYLCKITQCNTFDSRSQWERMPNCPLIELPPHAAIMDYDSLSPDSEWNDYEDEYTAYSIYAIRAACIPAEEELIND